LEEWVYAFLVLEEGVYANTDCKQPINLIVWWNLHQ